jgi:superoxide dismutase, Cu-Zn family
MEPRQCVTGLSLCGLLFTVAACGREANERSQSDTDRSEAIPRLEPAGEVRARATIAGPPGSGIKGEVTLSELRGNFPEPGVQIEARVTGPAGGLTPGLHGFHIHENAKGGCVPPYTSAGGHLDPGPAGNPDPDVNHPFHTGDIPNLVVDAGGVGTLKTITSRITLSPGPLSVFDENGSAFILHEEADKGTPGPAKSGVSGGPRIACGVIERDSA